MPAVRRATLLEIDVCPAADSGASGGHRHR